MNFEEFKERYQFVPVEEFPNRVLETVPSPEVSVRISTYQHAPYIRECIEGILMQKTDFPFEILIGEDESTDGTREICIEYAKEHPDKIRLFLHRRENNIKIDGRPTGKFQALYTQLMMRGRYTAICEGDDYWTNPRKLTLQYSLMEKNPDYSMCGGKTKILVQENPSFEYFISPKVIKDSYLVKDVIGPYLMHTSTFFTRVGTLNVHEWQLKAICGDTLALVASAEIGPIGYIDELFSVYRIHHGGVWSGARIFSKFEDSIHAWEVANDTLNRRYDRLFGRALYYCGVSHFKECIASGYYRDSLAVAGVTRQKVTPRYRILLLFWPFIFACHFSRVQFARFRIWLGIRTRFRNFIKKYPNSLRAKL
jgi:glycosyltransferase involved in cell wall biosynthesis